MMTGFSKRLPKGQRYIVLTHVAAVTLVAGMVAFAVDAPDFLKGLPMGMLVALIAMLFVGKMRDEFVERLWNVGTAAAFLAAIGATLGVELVRGFADAGADVFALPPLLSPLAVGAIVLGAFFAAFHVALWRSR